MSRSVDNQESGNVEVQFNFSSCSFDMFEQVVLWEVSSADLLSDASSFSSLDVCVPQLVENEGLASVYVTKDAENWTPQIRPLWHLRSLSSWFGCHHLLDFWVPFYRKRMLMGRSFILSLIES